MKANLLLSVLFVNLLLFSCKNDTSLPQVTQIPFKTSNSDNYGMMNPDGTILFEDEFKNMPSIAVNNIFSVKDAEGKLSYFTAEEKTQLISNEKYIDGGYYSEGIIPVVKSESSISFIDKKGREIFTLGTFEGKKIQAVNAYFSDGLMLFKIEGNKYGYINSKGQVAIKPVYDLAFPFNEKVAIVGKEKKNTETMDYYIIDCSGREIVRLKDIDFIKFDWNSMFFSDIYTNGNKAFNKKGERIFRSPSKWKVLLPYNENYTMFTTENNYGIVNKEGEIVIRNKYDVGIMNMKDHFIGINSSDSKYDLFFLDSNENRTTKIESIDDCSILSQDRIIIKEQDEYYFRAYYMYKYIGGISSLSFSLFILSYSAARKMEDDLKIRKIENILASDSADKKYKEAFAVIKDYYDSLYKHLPLTDMAQKYKNIKKYDWELPVRAELTCEYFHYIYRNTKMNKPTYINLLNECINYAMNELIISNSSIDMVEAVDETVLRLKIIYEISPCVLDQLNDYDKFKKLYNKSQELSYSKNVRQHGIGEYVENVFNRKAFLFANQAACNIYYEKAKSYFARNEIWVEYYITLVCQAGTDIVIQEFDEAIELCKTAVFEANQRDIKIPQIEKLYNNQIIAEFLLAEQDAKTPQKTISFAQKAIKELRALLTGEKNATQFVIYTNICSLYLYSNNDKQYVTYKRKLEKLYECKDISNVADESIDDFYRYYFSWFELYRKINSCNWEDAWHYVNQLDDFVPALFRKQEIFWNEKNDAVKQLINNKETISAYNFCHNLVKTKRTEQVLSKFFYRGLMLSDLQYTSYS